jgi:hypothetical protein
LLPSNEPQHAVVELLPPHAVAELLALDVDELERLMLTLPQMEYQTTHHFGPGVCIREVIIPAGAFVIGHAHKGDSMNVMLKGRLALRTPDGDVREVTPPLMMTTGPGRKWAYAMEDTVWWNVFATDETDVEKIEEQFVTKSDAWKAAREGVAWLS